MSPSETFIKPFWTIVLIWVIRQFLRSDTNPRKTHPCSPKMVNTQEHTSYQGLKDKARLPTNDHIWKG